MLRISKLDPEVKEQVDRLFYGEISPAQFMAEMSELVKARRMPEIEAFDLAERCIGVYEKTLSQTGSWKDYMPIYERRN